MVYSNPKVFFVMEVDSQRAGRIEMELFSDTTPITAENFRALCTGEKGKGICGKPLHFKGSVIHRVEPDLLWEGGDIINGDGSGSESIYGPTFPKEFFRKSHDRPGILTMNPESNGSQFKILTKKQTTLDSSHVVFGEVVEGLDVIKRINAMDGVSEGLKVLKIADCGQIVFDEPEEIYLDVGEGPGTAAAMKEMLHELADKLRATYKEIAELGIVQN